MVAGLAAGDVGLLFAELLGDVDLLQSRGEARLLQARDDGSMSLGVDGLQCVILVSRFAYAKNRYGKRDLYLVKLDMQPPPPSRALVVDDDAGIARLLSRCLSMWGWEVEECHSIAAALAAFPQGAFALAVCDVDLPDGDGIALAQVLVKEKPSLAVVIVSGLPDNLDRARRGGLAACLRKPFELPELKALIDSPRSDKESLDLA